MTKIAIIGAGPCGLSMLRAFEHAEQKGRERTTKRGHGPAKQSRVRRHVRPSGRPYQHEPFIRTETSRRQRSPADSKDHPGHGDQAANRAAPQN